MTSNEQDILTAINTGTGSPASIQTITIQTRLSPEEVVRTTAEMVEDGKIKIVRGDSPGDIGFTPL